MSKISILYITSILCHHELGLWDWLNKDKDVSFVYLATSNPNVTISSRYLEDEKRSYAKCSHNFDNASLKKMVESFDIIYIGDIQDERIWELIANKNNVVPVLEHYSRFRPFFPNFVFEILRRVKFYLRIKKRLERIHYRYALCISYYASEDIHFCFKDQITLEFSYFKNYVFPTYDCLEKKDKYKILYVGRNIECKHPKTSISFFKEFNNYNLYEMTIVGEGLNEIIDMGRYDRVTYMPHLSHQKMMEAFELSGIFVFPSDRREGWGVVLNEAMSKGCIVFACKRAGSTNTLVVDGVNGFSYTTMHELRKKIKKYHSMNDADILRMRINALNTIKNVWNGEVAAKRIKQLSLSIKNGEDFAPYQSGPLSLTKF